MNVEIINVGTELLLGEIVNTNAPYLFKMCKDLGFDIYYQSVVGDNPERLEDCLSIAFKRGADCVITTGGLGPTQDDLTKELSAKFLGLDLVYNEEEARKVDEKCTFVVGKENVTQNNFKQAYYPKNAYILENPVGTANGCVMENGGHMIINLPGPPKEMTYVVDHSLMPFLEKYREDRIYTHDFVTMGIGESQVDDCLCDLQKEQTDVSLAMYAGEGSVRVRIAKKAKSEEEAQKKMTAYRQEIEKRLRDYILPDNSLDKALARFMQPVRFTGDLEMPEWFVPYYKEDAALIIDTQVEHNDLGDLIHITYNSEDAFTIPALKDYHLSQTRVESRIKLHLYLYLKKSH